MQQLSLKRKFVTINTALALLFFAALYFLVVNVDFTLDRSDGIFHYLFARNAPAHPKLYLDLWAKPLFTLAASPFAQLGIVGIHFMNVLCAVITVLILICIAQKFQLNHSWLLFFLLIPMPVYFSQLGTAMTEPFFALILTFIVYLFLEKKFISSALLASVLPFARQEGYFLLPLMAVVFALIKEWRAIPALLSGSVLISIISYFSVNDFLWLIHQHPYTGAEDIYGKGHLLHFVKNSEAMFGFAVQIFLAGGLFIYSTRLFKQLKSNIPFREDIKLTTEIFLICGFAIGFFIAHSIMWWKGLFGSYGLERVMACIAPLISLIALRFISSVTEFLNARAKTGMIKNIFILFVAAISLIILFTRSSFPPHEKLTDAEKTVSSAGDWLNDEKISYTKIYFSHPYLILKLKLDPKVKKNSEELMYTNGGASIKKGEIVIWDSEFAPGQHHFPLSILQQDSAYVQLKKFTGEKTEAYIFRKEK